MQSPPLPTRPSAVGAQRVVLTLFSARELIQKSTRSEGNACYCVVQMIGAEGYVGAQRKTNVILSESPAWNETVTFDCTTLENVHLVTVEVWHKSRAMKDRFLGRVLLPVVPTSSSALRGAAADRCSARSWWPLGRRSGKSHVGFARIELQLDCSRYSRGDRARDAHARCFERAQAALALPLDGGESLPPAAKERLLHAVDCMMRDSRSGRVVPCTVMLTDWRLLWLKQRDVGRASSRHASAAEGHAPLQLLRAVRVVDLASDGSGLGGLGGGRRRRRLNVETSDFRLLQFETAKGSPSTRASLLPLHTWLVFTTLNPQLLLDHFDLSIHGAESTRSVAESEALSARGAAQRDGNHAADLQRMGVAATAAGPGAASGGGWCEPRLNRNFQLCDSYPPLVALPAAFMRDAEAVRGGGGGASGGGGGSDDGAAAVVAPKLTLLEEVAKFRSRGRVPALVWRDARTGVTVTRCSQPNAGLNHAKRSAADERLLEAICLSAVPASAAASVAAKARLQIIDARPKLNAIANQGKGKGFEFCAVKEGTKATDRGNEMHHEGGSGLKLKQELKGQLKKLQQRSQEQVREPHYPRAEIHFCDIANIHVMRKALAQMHRAQQREFALRMERIERDSELADAGLAFAKQSPIKRGEGGGGSSSSSVLRRGGGGGRESFFSDATIAGAAADAAHGAIDARVMREAIERAAVESGWAHHVTMVLRACVRAVEEVHLKRRSVLIHCSDGWDRTPQLCALTQLMLDPTYRTLEGFALLVQTEWCGFGHKFAQRTRMSIKASEESPIFVQWLDCVHQLMAQFPSAFEFNDALLVLLATHAQSGWFADFLFDTERERRAASAYGRARSVWDATRGAEVEGELSACFANELYTGPVLRVLVPDCSDDVFRVWTGYYLRDERKRLKTGSEVRGYIADPRFDGALRYAGATMW